MSVDERFQDYVSRPLPETLSELVQDKATGILTAMGVEAHRGIVLVDGEIRAARSTLEEEKLGLFLVGKQWLDEKDRAQALLTQATADAPPFGEVLVARGFISASELEGELQELALTIICRAASDSTAYTEFFEDPEGVHLDTLTHLTTTQVLLNVARSYEDLDAKYRRLGDRGCRVQLVADLDVSLDDLEVTPTEAFVLSRAKGRPRLQDLIQGASLPEEKAVATIYSLVIAGLIRIGVDGQAAESQGEVQVGAEPEISENQMSELQEIKSLAEAARRTDHYQALGLERSATDEEIIDAWTSIRQRYAVSRTSEPHLGDAGPWLETIQDRAQDAYQVLGDPATRRRYNSVMAGVDKARSRVDGQLVAPVVDPAARTALVEANLKRADELIRDGEVFSALQMLEQACAIEARPSALLKLAQLQLKNPKWDAKSLRTLHKALEVDPDFIDAWLELADFWHRRNDADRRRKALEKVIALDPRHPKAVVDLAGASGKKPLSRMRNLFRSKKK
ncbi:MAG: hypothetical protein DRJ65_09250 [Acidobacteria bacterium]|nr:MAG: hypothetical protein DRJ65_09250 [Acidobacteriota bacterium]